MQLKVKLRNDAFMLERAHATDAGLDIRTPEAFTLAAHGSEVIATGVYVELPRGTAGMLKSKSGLNVVHDITSDGVIDEGYSGEITVKLYNHGDRPHRFERGDKVSQLVIVPVMYADPVEVDSITGGERGANGIGSTGR